MYDAYLIWDNRLHKPVFLVSSLEQAIRFCEANSPYAWETQDDCTRFSLGTSEFTILDYKIFKVTVMGDT